MNDKTKSRVDTKIETEALKDDELGDEELEKVSGGVMPRIRRGRKGLFTMDGSTDELFTMDDGPDE